MILLKLKQTGFCFTCKKEFELPSPRFYRDGVAAPYHEVAGKKCKGSGISAHNVRPVIKSEKEAIMVAAFLSTDDGRCFEMSGHSIACGDGRYCAQARLNLAGALATYFLDEYGPRSAKVA